MEDVDLASMRRDYAARPGASAELTEADLAPDWLTQLHRWLGEAAATQTEAGGVTEPNAMVLATVDELGRPTTRTVLLKGLDERGLVFFTNYDSRKGRQLADRPYASVTFPWFALMRQVSVTGAVERVTPDETRAYHDSRPRDSQLGAWASPQSSVVAGRAALDAALAEVTARFADAPVPVPPHWGGLRIRPETVEFWQGRHGRLHDRLRYRLVAGDTWIIERLAP